jgi:MbtH protein
MAETDEEDGRQYRVVINHEEQYSIWFADREYPQGWRYRGFSGTKIECLDYIGKVWTDITPLSLRKAMGDVPE